MWFATLHHSKVNSLRWFIINKFSLCWRNFQGSRKKKKCRKFRLWLMSHRLRVDFTRYNLLLQIYLTRFMPLRSFSRVHALKLRIHREIYGRGERRAITWKIATILWAASLFRTIIPRKLSCFFLIPFVSYVANNMRIFYAKQFFCFLILKLSLES